MLLGAQQCGVTDSWIRIPWASNLAKSVGSRISHITLPRKKKKNNRDDDRGRLLASTSTCSHVQMLTQVQKHTHRHTDMYTHTHHTLVHFYNPRPRRIKRERGGEGRGGEGKDGGRGEER